MSRFLFTIPEFQREYAWTSEEVSEFFSDLSKALDGDFYFLGLIVITGTGTERTVVDGQQRLLTLSLLAAALRDEAAARKRVATASDLTSTFLQAIDFESDAHVHRVRLSSAHDSAVFSSLTTGLRVPGSEPGNDARDDVRSLLRESAAHLRRELRKDINASGDELERIGKWAHFLTNTLQFAVFDHPDPASAYRVFEIINTRGKELTPTDLLKSYMLSVTTADDRASLYERWTDMVEKFRQIDQLGQITQFVRHVMTVLHGYVAPRDLYDRVSREYPDAPGVLALMGELDDRVDLYLQMIDPSLVGPATEPELAAYEAFRELGVIVARPMLFALNEIGAPDEGIRELVRLIVRRIVTGYLGTGAVERRLSGAARSIARDQDWRAVMTSLEDLNPTREDFKRQLASRPFNKSVLGFILRSVADGEPAPGGDDYRYVHSIRPRVAPEWVGFPDEDLTRWGSTVGNAVLASEERRPRGTNTWDDFKQNLLPLLSPAERDQLRGHQSWTTRSVQDRGKRLAESAATAWY